MKTFILILVTSTFLLAGPHTYAQPDTAKISQRALFYADSLIKTDTYKDFSAYADLAPATVLKHYGGKDGFIDHFRTGRPRTVSSIEEEDKPELKIMTLETRDDQWQILIRESRYIHRDDNKKYHLITYFLGQSKDEGETWHLFDISYNKVANIIYMLPDVFDDIAIPEPSIISEEEELAKQQAAAAAAKKPAAKKK